MARRPDTTQVLDLPVLSTYRQNDRKQQIDSILREHDHGMFSRSAPLVDEILTDDRIAGVTDARTDALLATPVEFKPAGPRRKERKIAQELGGKEDIQGTWREMFAPAAISEMLRWGIFLGVAVARIEWQRQARKWSPRLVPWHPQFVRWDWMKRRFTIQTENLGEIDLPRPDQEPNGDGEWFVWCPFGVQYGWRRGLIRSLADKYLKRQWNERDWARYCEKHGLGILVAKVPNGAKDPDKQAFFGQLATIASEPTILAPQADDPSKSSSFGVDLVEAQARTWETFKEWKASLNADIAIRMLGQNLTTEVGDAGSKAAESGHEGTKTKMTVKDAEIFPAFRAQVLVHDAAFNYGDPELAPRPEAQVEPPEDEAQEGAAFKALGDGIQSLKTAGAAIDVRAVLEPRGIPMLSIEEEEAEKAVAAEQAAAIAGGEGGGAPGDGDGGAGGDDEEEDAEPAPPDGKRAFSASARVPVPGPVRRYTFQGFAIAVENPAGSIRVWHDRSAGGAVIGSTKMVHDYGFIEGAMGSDKEELDCYVGPDETAAAVHIVHQLRAPAFKVHDEDKVMLGFPSADAALAAYVAHRNDGDRAVAGMSTIPLERFRAQLVRRKGTGKIRAHHATVRAIMALAARSSGTVQARARLTARGKRRTKLYSDRVADRAIPLAARALAVDLVGLKAEIDAATSFEDLEQRVKRLHGRMDPRRLARVVEKTRVMAQLGGRLSAVEDL